MIRVFLTAMVVAALLIARRSAGIFLPTFFYEDGTTFYVEQLVTADPLLFLTPFRHGFYQDGYLLLFTRLSALLAWSLPVALAPYVMNFLGAFAVAASSALITHERFRPLLGSDLLRTAFAALVAVSLDSGEYLATSTNAFWCFALPIVLLVSDDAERSCFWNVLAALLVVFLALSTPLSALLVPFAIVRLKACRYRSVALAALLGGLAQILVSAVLQPPSGGASVLRPGIGESLLSIGNALVFPVFLQSLVGASSAQRVAVELSSFGASWAFLLVALVLAGAMLASHFARSRGEAVALLYLLLAPLLLGLFKRDAWTAFLDPASGAWGPFRYFYPSRVVFVWCLFRVLGDRSRSRGIAVASILAVLPAAFASFKPPEPTPGPEVRFTSYSRDVEAWEAAARTGSPPRVVVRSYLPPDWKLVFPGSVGRGISLEGDLRQGAENEAILPGGAVATGEAFLPPGRGLRVIIRASERCAGKSSAGRFVLRARDSYGDLAEDSFRDSHCANEGELALELPSGKRRAAHLELRALVPGADLVVHEVRSEIFDAPSSSRK